MASHLGGEYYRIMNSRFENFWRSLTGKQRNPGDIALAVAVLAMIAIMIMPLPAMALDFFLTLNLALGAILLMSAVLTPTGVRIFTFPTLLVITTLFRLALDISSTRLILTEADAGQVIRSFGDFAAGGSLVAGIVVFLIITMVQLIVISKGAEQTSLATAHFVRDSIPGRQQAIESDATAARITPAMVQMARDRMEVEVEFFGRMYGAMQFIKGDSIASLVVSAINIVGGLVTGVVVNHMSIGDALETYTLLTVGAGLVSQIPALVGSVAGTILVSRVTAGPNAGEGLGGMVLRQFGRLPQALVMAGVMLLALGIVPGMPSVWFLGLGSVLCVVGYRQSGSPAGVGTGIDPRQDGEPLPLTGVPPLELIAGADVGADELELVRIAASEFLRHYVAASGIALSDWFVRRGATTRGTRLEIRRSGVVVAGGTDWAAIMPGFKRDLINRPAAGFGYEQVVYWMESISRSHPKLGTPFVDLWKPKPLELAKVLQPLVEEHVPISNSRVVAEYLVGKASLSPDQIDEAHKDLRLKLSAESARFYFEWFVDENTKILKVTNGSALYQSADLQLQDGLKKIFEHRDGNSIIVLDKENSDHRRKVGKAAKAIYEQKEIPFPVLVVTEAEVMGTALPGDIPVIQLP